MWRETFAPGIVGATALIGLAVAAAVLAAVDAQFRRRAVPWVVGFVAAAGTAAVCALGFITANDLYVPDVASTFNRLNFPGCIAYCVAFVSLAGLGWEIARRVLGREWVATTIVAIGVLGIAYHQVGMERNHQEAWRASWDEQRDALAGYRVALADAPKRARVLGFDTPLWERGFVPVFSATWDLRGAFDLRDAARAARCARVPPKGRVCSRRGGGEPSRDHAVRGGGRLATALRQPGAACRPSRRTSMRACQRLVAAWGVPPFWGETVTAR